jgi:protease-4
MNTYEKFLGIVARERHLSADVLRNGIADGRILSGRDALQYKLIDGLGQVEDAYAKAKELGHAPTARIEKYAPPHSLGRFLRLFVKGGETRIELSRPGQLSPQLQSGHAYFLPSFYAP